MNKYGWYWSGYGTNPTPTVIPSTSFVFYYPRQLSLPFIIEFPFSGMCVGVCANNSFQTSQPIVSISNYSPTDYYIANFTGYDGYQIGFDTRAFEGSEFLTNVLINTTIGSVNSLAGLCYSAGNYICGNCPSMFQTGLPFFYMYPWPTNGFNMTRLFYNTNISSSCWDDVVSQNSWIVCGNTYKYLIMDQIFDTSNLTDNAYLALLEIWLNTYPSLMINDLPITVGDDYQNQYSSSSGTNQGIYANMFTLNYYYGFTFVPLKSAGKPINPVDPPVQNEKFIVIHKKGDNVVIPRGFVVVHKKHKKHHKKRVPKKRNMKKMMFAQLPF
jgi:hypothetical protein